MAINCIKKQTKTSGIILIDEHMFRIIISQCEMTAAGPLRSGGSSKIFGTCMPSTLCQPVLC